MRLKKLKKHETYTIDLCAASRCRQVPGMVYDKNTILGRQAGGNEVPLCDMHNEKYCAEADAEAAMLAMMDEDDKVRVVAYWAGCE